MAETTVEAAVNARRALSQEQVDFFAANGFLRVGKVLDAEQIERLRVEYDREFALAAEGRSSFRNLAITDTDDLKAKNRAPKKMLQIMQMCERNIEFRRLIFESKILDIAEDLIGPNIQLFHDQALFKPPRHGGPVHWHQDNAYWKCAPATLVSCWLTLDDVDLENGAMQFIPGSHLAPARHAKSTSDALLEVDRGADAPEPVVVDLPAGGVTFHHCQTLHYTAPNGTDRQRRAFAIHFMTPGTRSLATGKTIEVSFKNPMLRMKV